MRAPRGATLVEYLILVGIALLAVLGGAAFYGQAIAEKLGEEGRCLVSGDCSPGGGGDDGHAHAGESRIAPGVRVGEVDPAPKQKPGTAPKKPPAPTTPAPRPEDELRRLAPARLLMENPEPDAPGMEAGEKTVADSLARLPPQILEEMDRYKMRVILRPNNIAKELPSGVGGDTPRGWPTGSSLGALPAVFMPHRNVVVIGVKPDGSIYYPGVVRHELAHGMDQNRGYPSRSEDFKKAYEQDAKTKDPFNSTYYRTQENGGSQTSMTGALSETYATAWDTYHSNPGHLRTVAPNLYDYFSRTEPKP